MLFIRRSWLLGNIALAITAGALQGQEVTGTLVGTVKDSGGKVVSGALVVLTSPKMISPRRVTTDEQGNFRAPLIPPGEYAITVSKEGYVGIGAKDVRVSVGANIRQDFAIKPMEQQAPSATVEVFASAGTVDKTDTKAATSLSFDQLLTIPTASGDRNFGGAMDLAPSVTTNEGGGTSIRGGKTQETGYTLNGASVKDDYAGAIVGTMLVDDAVEDTQVIQSPLHARFGRTGGGIVNVVTKAGGNDFSGTLRTYTSRDDWRAVRHNEPNQRANARVSKQWDLSFNGPIVKDRLWFSLATIQRPAEANRNEVLRGEAISNWVTATPTGGFWNEFEPGNPNFSTPRPLYGFDKGAVLMQSLTQDYFDSKITGAITADHTVDFTFHQDKNTITNRNPYGDGDEVPIIATVGSNSKSQVELSKYYSYGYRGVLSSRSFLEARYSRKLVTIQWPSPSLPHMRLDYPTSNFGAIFPYGLNLSDEPEKRDNQSGSLNFKQFLEYQGNHEIDVGLDFFESIRRTQTKVGGTNQIFFVPAAVDMSNEPGWDGGVDPYGKAVGFQAVNWLYARSFGDLAQPSTGYYGQSAVLRQGYGQDGTTKNRTLSLYINDAWAINNHFNLMVGLRADHFRVIDTDNSVLVSKKGPLSPRLQFKYDVDGTTKHLFSATAAKYVNEFGTGFTDGFVKKANSKNARFGYTGVANGPNTAKWVGYDNIINAANYGYAFSFFDASKNNILDNLSNPYVLEWTLGYRRSYEGGSYFQVTLINKDWKNDFVYYQDLVPLEKFHVQVTDPTGSGMAPKDSLARVYGNSSEIKRNYKAMELEFRHNINANWVFGGNYTYSRLTGNDNGGDQIGQSFFDLDTLSAPLQMKGWLEQNGTPKDVYAPGGLLVSNQTHKVRAYLTAIRPLGKGRISYSGLLRYDSGYNWGISGDQLLPNLAGVPSYAVPVYTAWYSKRGAFSYNDTYQMDVKVDWSAPLSFKKLQLMGYVQIDNVFNAQLQSRYNNVFDPSLVDYGTQRIPVLDPATFGTDGGSDAYSNWIGGRFVRASIGLKF